MLITGLGRLPSDELSTDLGILRSSGLAESSPPTTWRETPLRERPSIPLYRIRSCLAVRLAKGAGPGWEDFKDLQRKWESRAASDCRGVACPAVIITGVGAPAYSALQSDVSVELSPDMAPFLDS